MVARAAASSGDFAQVAIHSKVIQLDDSSVGRKLAHDNARGNSSAASSIIRAIHSRSKNGSQPSFRTVLGPGFLYANNRLQSPAHRASVRKKSEVAV